MEPFWGTAKKRHACPPQLSASACHTRALWQRAARRIRNLFNWLKHALQSCHRAGWKTVVMHSWIQCECVGVCVRFSVECSCVGVCVGECVYVFVCLHTRCIMPAAVNHTDIKIDTSWAKRIELDVFSTFKYCKISGTVMRRSARRNRRPVYNTHIYGHRL